MTHLFEIEMDDYCYEQSEPKCSTKRNQRPLMPVQLASKKCNCHHCQWNGEVKECEQKWITTDQMKAHYDKRSQEPKPKKVSEPEISPPGMKILAWQKPLNVDLQDLAPASPKKTISAWQKPLNVEVQDLAPSSPKKTISALQTPDNVDLQDLAPASPKKTISAWQKPLNVEVQDLAPASPKKTISAWQKPLNVEAQDLAPASPKTASSSLQTQIEPNDVEVNIRSNAFSALADIKKIDGALLRTRLCDSVANQKACRHGVSCRFAHNIDELVFANCLFGTSCRHVKSQGNGVYTSVFGKACNRLHPGETNASVCARSEIKVVPPKSTPNFRKPTPVVVSTPKQISKSTPTVLRVPIEMAVLAMEFATKSGKTNIRIEII